MTYDISLRDPGVKFNISFALPTPPGSPFLVMVAGVDARHVDLFMSEEMNDGDMFDVNNYTFSGPGSVQAISVEKLTAQSYRVTTTEQTRGATYTLLLENVRDLEGNFA
jgi:tRNA U54 and U55 pseudouridine synthase Pus10